MLIATIFNDLPLCLSLFAVSQLREHWEDTSSKVMSRKNQLTDLLQDQQSFEAKRREIEAWLGRMEAWQARMRPVGSTQDVLEAQVREQKVRAKRCVIGPYTRPYKRPKFELLTGNLRSNHS